MSEESRTVCEACRQVVTADEPGVVQAFEQVATGAFGDPADNNDVSDGFPVLFHERCFPKGSPRYRLAD